MLSGLCPDDFLQEVLYILRAVSILRCIRDIIRLYEDLIIYFLNIVECVVVTDKVFDAFDLSAAHPRVA